VRLIRIVLLLVVVRLGAQNLQPEDQKYLLSVLPLIERGELTQAQQQLARGMKLYPQSAILYNALGIVYRRQNNTDAAIAAFQEALKLMPAYTAAQLQLGSIYQQRSLKKEAAEMFRAAGESTTNFEALVSTGLALADCEDFAGAARVLAKARAQRPDSTSVVYNLALAEYNAADAQSAMQTLDSVPAAQREPDVLYLRGKVKQALARPDAGDEYLAACRAQPENENYCTDAALALVRRERAVEALELLQAGLEKSPDSVSLLSLSGLTQFRLGRYQDAIGNYTRALEHDPGLDASREGLAFLFYVTGDLEKARQVAEQGLENPDADFYLAHLHGMILYRLSPQLRGAALVAANRALQANPKFAPSYFLRGKIKMEQNEAASALADFERAVALDPKYPLPYYKMSQIYARQGRANDAEAARRKFSDLGSLREEEILARQTLDVLMPAQR